MPLPIAREIDARLSPHREVRKTRDLVPIRKAAVIFTPSRLLRGAEQIGAEWKPWLVMSSFLNPMRRNSCDLGMPSKAAFVLCHKLREATA